MSGDAKEGLTARDGSAGCEWTKEGTNEWYQSDCGYSFDFLDEGPMESGFHFCPFCGRRLVAETAKSPNAHRERLAKPHRLD